MSTDDLTSFLMTAVVIGVGVASSFAIFLPLMRQLGVSSALFGTAAANGQSSA